MDKILAIAHYTTLESLRNKIYHVIVLFGFLMLGASLLLGVLAVEEELRLLVDLGLGAMEMLGLMVAVFGSVTLILEEMNSRALYLILTRPIKRYHYLLGRAGGLWFSIAVSLLLMSVGHVSILYLKGWVFDPRYVAAVFFLFLKIMLVSSLAILFSLASTSSMSSVVFTLFFWTMGHFGPELKFLAEKIQNTTVSVLFQGVYLIIPNLQFFNLRDQWDAGGAIGTWLTQASLYAAVYTGACLAAAVFLFRRKEF